MGRHRVLALSANYSIYRCGHKASIALWWTAQYGEFTALAVPVAPAWQAKVNTGVTRATCMTGIKIKTVYTRYSTVKFSLTFMKRNPIALCDGDTGCQLWVQTIQFIGVVTMRLSRCDGPHNMRGLLHWRYQWRLRDRQKKILALPEEPAWQVLKSRQCTPDTARSSFPLHSLTLTKRNPIPPCDEETQCASYECKLLTL